MCKARATIEPQKTHKYVIIHLLNKSFQVFSHNNKKIKHNAQKSVDVYRVILLNCSTGATISFIKKRISFI